MRLRNFSFSEKVQIIFSNSTLVFGLIWTFFMLVIVSMVYYFVREEIALNTSNDYVEGKIIAVDKQVYDGIPEYNYLILYKVNGVSYQITPYSAVYTEGHKVKVRYISWQPDYATVEELDPSSFPVFVFVIVGIFFLIGFYLLYYGLTRSLKYLYILQNGELAYGKFLYSEPTGVTINDKQEMKLFFAFRDKNGIEQKTFAITHSAEFLQDEEFEKLVYMPSKDNESVFLDILPSFVRKKLVPEYWKLRK